MATFNKITKDKLISLRKTQGLDKAKTMVKKYIEQINAEVAGFQLEPVENKPKGFTMTQIELFTYFKTKIGQYLKTNPLMPDSKYFILSPESFQTFNDNFNGRQIKYVPENFDCDNYAALYFSSADVSFKDFRLDGDVAVGEFWFYYTVNGIQYGHAMNIVPIGTSQKDLELYIIEPQMDGKREMNVIEANEFIKTKSNFEIAYLKI